MWNTIVSSADAAIGRLALGLLNVSSDHPLLFVAGAAVLLHLTLAVWADLIRAGRDTLRPMAPRESERAIRLRW